VTELSEQELRLLVSLAKRALWADRATRRAIQDEGIHIAPANFYSSIPLLSDVEASFEYREEAQGAAPYATGGLFDPETMLAFLARISGYAEEFDPPVQGDPDNPAGFFWGNPAFSHSDAMAYYCVLRTIRPKRVVEVGAGFSTLVADRALQANGTGEIIVVEPFPKPFLRDLASVSRIIERPVQSVPAQELVDLVNGAQVWFIDSTHTVKSGSDCLYLYLKVMPQVTSEVLCHSHDIYLPYAMPRNWALDRNIFWTEQYLLHAYLLDNPKAQVLFSSHLLHKTMRDESRRFLRGRYADGGGSLWYRLNGKD
jgi:hypothetical protein